MKEKQRAQSHHPKVFKIEANRSIFQHYTSIHFAYCYPACTTCSLLRLLYYNILSMCKKPPQVANHSNLPLFKPFSTFERKSYIKKTAREIAMALDNLDLNDFEADI